MTPLGICPSPEHHTILEQRVIRTGDTSVPKYLRRVLFVDLSFVTSRISGESTVLDRRASAWRR